MKKRIFYAVSMILLGLMLTSTFAVFRAYAPATTWVGYVKPSYPDYAPSGMPDFDERQDGWGPAPGTYTWCGPVAVANSLWWLDSEYESIMFASPVPPPTVSDHFNLVNSTSQWDDHDPNNVLPLVPNLALLMDTDGLRTQDGHIGTRWPDLESGIKQYLAQQGVSRYFEVHNMTFPSFIWIDNETEMCQDVELFLEFYQWTGGIWTNSSLGNPSLEAGHFVTCAGANATLNPGEVLISDPLQDAFEAGTAPRGGREPVLHPAVHPTSLHNDAQYVSQDAYQVTQWVGPQPGPYGPLQPVYELVGYLQTMGYADPNWHAFIRAAVATSPIELEQWQGYVKPAFPDYTPSGMPDFDEKQDLWGPGQGTYTWCVPVSVANSLWWLDSEYESLSYPAPVPPPAISDHFGLVTAYGQWDDHDSNNVDPLVRNLAFLMDTDGLRTHDGHTGTRWADVQSGIEQYLVQQGVVGMFEVHNSSFPDFVWISNETERCQDVELFLEFWQWTGTGWTNATITNPSLELGHCVTSAGVNSSTSEVLISDPWQDAYEAGAVPGRSPIPHVYPHNTAVHNDAQYVSQDAYAALPFIFGPMPPPPGYAPIVLELQGYLQTMGFDPSYHAFIRGAVATSPLEAGTHDVAVTNVATSKTGCIPMPTVGQGHNANVTVTVQNIGSFNESLVSVTAYATPSMPPGIVIGSTTVSIDAGKNVTVTFSWSTIGVSYGNYTISATAGPVLGETNTLDNTLTDGMILVTIPGDINGDLKVTLQDLVFLANSYGSRPGGVKWNPNADINGNGVDDLADLVILASHYGQHFP